MCWCSLELPERVQVLRSRSRVAGLWLVQQVTRQLVLLGTQNMARLLKYLGRHGIAPTLNRAAHKLRNRLFQYDTLDVMWTSTKDAHSNADLAPVAYQIRTLQRDEMLRLPCLTSAGMQSPYIEQALDRNDECLAVMVAGEPACVCWYARSGPVVLYRLWNIDFPDGCIYVHAAYTAPAHRGKRLLEQNLHAALARYAGSGATALFGMVESSNYPSLKAFRRAGYAHHGTVHAAAIAGRVFIRHSSECTRLGIVLTVRPDQQSANHNQKSISHAA